MEKKPLLIIHGLRSRKKMYEPLMRSLSISYECAYFEYNVKKTVPEIVYNLREFLFQTPSLMNAHFSRSAYDVLTYSFGAIIFRNYLAKYGEKNVGRVVMAVPTNQGSELLRHAMNTRLGRFSLGTLGQDYIKNEQTYLAPQPKSIEVGVVAGSKTESARRLPTPSQLFAKRAFRDKASDGKVKIEETKLQKMKDFTTVDAYHDELAYHPKFLELASNFLRAGSFAG